VTGTGRICKNCGATFRHAEFAHYDVCDECKDTLKVSVGYPFGGETCPICGGTIQYIGNIGWQGGYRCDGCGSEWWYD